MLKSLARLIPPALLVCLAIPAHALVVTTVKPLTLITGAVTEGLEAPVQLLPDGVSAHDYALRPSDRLQLRRADLVVWVGPEHERFLAPLLAGQANVLTLTRLPSLKPLPLRRLEDASPIPGSMDSHLWLDPDNAIRIAGAIADHLARREPARSSQYHANAARFASRLRTAWQPLRDRIAALPRHDYAAYHDAYQYLESSLGLRFAGSLSVSPESRPGARHLLLMKQRLRERQVYCLVREPASNPALLRQVAVAGGREAVLDETFRKGSDFVQALTGLGMAMEQCLRP